MQRRHKVNKLILLLVLIAGLCGGTAALAANVTGKVTESGTTRGIPFISVQLYKFNPVSGTFQFSASGSTDANGQFSVPADPGHYYIRFHTASSFQSDPFATFGYYQQPFNDLYLYVAQTYDGIGPDSNQAPTLVTVKNADVALNPIKLAKKKDGCVVTGPISIKGPLDATYEDYQSFNPNNGGPILPKAGGKLNVKLTVVNLHPKNDLKTIIQAVGFVTRQNAAYSTTFKGNRTVVPILGPPLEEITLRPGENVLSLTGGDGLQIPAALMQGTFPSPTGQWAFNVGLQASNASGLANCFSSPLLIPILLKSSATSATSTMASVEFEAQPMPEIIPLTLSEDGRVLEWGLKPSE
jgi:hypothetical protein